jgi:hypothetical protein
MAGSSLSSTRKAKAMVLAFPNTSRSFDQSRNAIRFIGHDGLFEVPFLIDAAALDVSPTVSADASSTEVSLLRAFDAMRDRIHAAAIRVHTRGHNAVYVLSAADLRAIRPAI